MSVLVNCDILLWWSMLLQYTVMKHLQISSCCRWSSGWWRLCCCSRTCLGMLLLQFTSRVVILVN